jgi:hypothetical protein
MPEICRFFGIIIYFYSDDHLPPHFHARYAEYETQISIETGNTIKGELPNKQLRLVQAWVELHREELYFNWEELQKDFPEFKKIDPIK